MNLDELKATNRIYKKYEARWVKYGAAFEGYESLVAEKFFVKHDRESQSNYARRIKHGYGPNYSESVVNIMDYYISQSEVTRKMGTLADDELWTIFNDDCDFMGSNFTVFLNQCRKMSSVYGHMGIIVDLPKEAVTVNRQENVEKSIYPYIAMYTPLDVLDWTYAKDAYGRPVLTMVKVKEEDGSYKIWTVADWQNWGLKDDKPFLIAEGVHDLGEVPFVWLYNGVGRDKTAGISDLKNIAEMDIAIYRNIMAVEEIIDLAAFPMMRKPMRRAGEEGEDVVGTAAVLEFDPSVTDGKPDWLPAVVQEPMNAIIEFIKFKIDEIYRCATLEETSSQRTQAESGFALALRKDVLNAALAAKSIMENETELKIVYLWLKWFKRENEYDEIVIERPKRFAVEDLTVDLGNALSAKSLVVSSKFKELLQKKISRQVLGSNATDDDYGVIDKEIEESVVKVVAPLPFPEKTPEEIAAERVAQE